MGKDFIVSKSGDLAKMKVGEIVILERAGDIAWCRIDNLLFQKAGRITQFIQEGKCSSLRRSKALIRKMIAIAFSESLTNVNHIQTDPAIPR